AVQSHLTDLLAPPPASQETQSREPKHSTSARSEPRVSRSCSTCRILLREVVDVASCSQAATRAGQTQTSHEITKHARRRKDRNPNRGRAQRPLFVGFHACVAGMRSRGIRVHAVGGLAV